MNRILNLALKDLQQILRNKLTFLFLLIMPVAFTLLFGFAFGGTKPQADLRLPVGFLDQDGGSISKALESSLNDSNIIILDRNAAHTPEDLRQLVSDEKLAAALVIPAGYGQALKEGSTPRLTLFTNPSSPSTISIQTDILAATQRLASAVTTARIAAATVKDPTAFDPAFDQALAAWANPPLQVETTSSAAVKTLSSRATSMAQSSPSMMLQFAIAGLLTAATVIVNERKTRSLQRLLTTATSRVQILLGHFLAIFSLIFIQFLLLIAFGQIALKVDYLRLPLATLLVALAAALCISALGLLIGILAKSDEQAIMFSLIPMFVLSGLGGAWVPLEATGEVFRSIGHLSPVAWAMDGFKNITARGLGFSSILLPAAALLGYAMLFFILAAWRFRRASE